MSLKKESLYIFITTFTILLAVIIVIAALGFYIGQTFGDYGDQHYYFIESIRQNFSATKDLFPQFNMNLGLGQSMSTMIYHGYLNPYVMFSYLFMNISTQMVMSIIIIFTIALTTTFSFIFLRKNMYSRNISLITSYMFGFAPFLIFHSHYHPMYIYYFPFAILNLIAIHRLVEKKHMGLLTLSFSLIFFLNFFFAPIVTIVNIFYFILLIYNKYEKKEYIVLYIKSYIISLLISLVILLPNFILFINSPRVETNNAIIETFGLNFGVLLQTTLNPYYAAMGIIVLCAIIFHLIARRNKKLLAITIFILVVSFFGIINYFLNVFQYVNYKQLIYLMPLATLLVANFLTYNNRIKKLIAKIVTVFLLVILMIAGVISHIFVTLVLNIYPQAIELLNGRMLVESNIIYFIFIAFSIYIILQCYITHINYKTISNLKTYILCFSIACISFFSFNVFIPKIETTEYTKTDSSNEIYRDETNSTNEVNDIDSYSPTIYASMVNGYYSEMLKTQMEVEVYGNERRVTSAVFNNEIMRFIFGIDDYNEEVMPMIYSKENSDIYSTEYLSTTNELLALLNGDFTTTSSNVYQPVELQYQTRDEVVVKDGEELSKTYEYQYVEDGVLYISFDASNDLCEKGFVCSISINEHKNDIYSYSESLYSPNDNFVYLIDITEDTMNLEVKASVGTWTLSNFTYTFIPSTQIEELKKDYVAVENFNTNINNGYSFTTNLLEDGYVFTTIPYDKGFYIYVDGVKVEPEIVNNYFLGFQVPAGYHEVEIIYIMPGFVIGSISTIIGLIILGSILYNEYIKRNKKSQKLI